MLPMTKKTYWHADNTPVETTIDRILYDIRKDDKEGLIFDSISINDIIEDSDGVLALDALITHYAKLEAKMNALQKVMERSGTDVKPVNLTISEPFMRNGVANVAAVFELSDGQGVTIFFHNPDVTPKKMMPTDELISWKWLLNKKDITIVVAPEKGVDLNIRQVAVRIMKLAQKNSAAFLRVNAKSAERKQVIDDLKTEISDLENELKQAQNRLEVAKVEKDEREISAIDNPTPESVEPETTTEIVEPKNKATLLWSEASEIKKKDFESLNELQQFMRDEYENDASKITTIGYDKHKFNVGKFNGIRIDVGGNDGDFNPFTGNLSKYLKNENYDVEIEPDLNNSVDDENTPTENTEIIEPPQDENTISPESAEPENIENNDPVPVLPQGIDPVEAVQKWINNDADKPPFESLEKEITGLTPLGVLYFEINGVVFFATKFGVIECNDRTVTSKSNQIFGELSFEINSWLKSLGMIQKGAVTNYEKVVEKIDPVAKANIEAANITDTMKKNALNYLNENPTSHQLFEKETPAGKKAYKAVMESIKTALFAEIKSLSLLFTNYDNDGGVALIVDDSSVIFTVDRDYKLSFWTRTGKNVTEIFDSTSTLEELRQWGFALPFDLDVKAFVANVIKPVVDEFLALEKSVSSNELVESSENMSLESLEKLVEKFDKALGAFTLQETFDNYKNGSAKSIAEGLHTESEVEQHFLKKYELNSIADIQAFDTLRLQKKQAVQAELTVAQAKTAQIISDAINKFSKDAIMENLNDVFVGKKSDIDAAVNGQKAFNDAQLEEFNRYLPKEPQNQTTEIDAEIDPLQNHIDTLQSVIDGKYDAVELTELLDMIDVAATAIIDAGSTDEYDALIGDAATKWAALDEKKNG